MRLQPALAPALAAALAAFAWLADRALVGQAAAARDAAVARIDEDARRAAEALQASLVRLEQAATAGQTIPELRVERFTAPPERAVPPRGYTPYGERPRAALAELLTSTRASPSGLPEAVVARLALGPAAPVTGAAGVAAVEERLLAGDLPVRPEDLPFLAARLGIGSDPRLAALAKQLAEAPDMRGLPKAPVYRRRLAGGGRIEGWAGTPDRRLLHYEVDAGLVLNSAGVAEHATIAVADTGGTSAAMSRTIAVPEVEGLLVRVSPRLPDALRLSALRGVLWLSAAAGLAGLVALRRALAREARAVERERAFLAGVTHELRTPLTTIRVLGETLADGRGEPREYGALVAQESERLEALVERVLTLARVEHAPRFDRVDPAELLRSAVALMRPRAERRRARIECRVEQPPPECRWDGEAVRRALVNLLDNAVTHGREGGHVLASVAAGPDQVRLAVTDDGPGIGKVMGRRVFGRFERGPTEAPGTGLGLYLVEEVARAHGGRVDLETGEGRGASFTLVLPCRPPGSESVEQAT